MTVAGFAQATAVVRRRDGSGQAGSEPGEVAYDAELDPGWRIADKPNGGYLLAVLARAALDAVREQTGQPHVLAASAHYLRAPEARAAVVEVELLRPGRAASQLRARLLQDAKVCVEALLTVGALDPAAAPWWGGEAAPAMPPPEQCVLLPAHPPGADYTVELMGQVLERLAPASAAFGSGRPSGTGELRGWLALADGADWDPLSLLLAVDALPPATFDLGTTGWVPTLELTAYVRALPAAGPVLVRQRARLVQDGLVDEVCDAWDSRGRLVASATQLAGVRVPDHPPASATAAR